MNKIRPRRLRASATTPTPPSAKRNAMVSAKPIICFSLESREPIRRRGDTPQGDDDATDLQGGPGLPKISAPRSACEVHV